MKPASQEAPATIPPCPDSSDEGRVPSPSWASHDGFWGRQLSDAGMTAVAEKIAAGRNLELEDAIALSRVSLPLLGKLIQLRPLPIAPAVQGGPAAAALPIERVDSPPKSQPRIGQAPADWESFCRALIALP